MEGAPSGATDESARSEMAGEFELTGRVAEDSKGGQWMQAEEYVGGPLGRCLPWRGCKQRTWTSLWQVEQGNITSLAVAPKHAGQPRPPCLHYGRTVCPALKFASGFGPCCLLLLLPCRSLPASAPGVPSMSGCPCASLSLCTRVQPLTCRTNPYFVWSMR